MAEEAAPGAGGKRFVAWNSLKTQFPEKAQLLKRLTSRDFLNYIRSYEPRKGFPTEERLTLAIRSYGVVIGNTLIEWLQADDQVCDADCIRLAKNDLRAVLKLMI